MCQAFSSVLYADFVIQFLKLVYEESPLAYPFYGSANRGLVSLRKFSKTTQLVSGRSETHTQECQISKPMLLTNECELKS